MPKLWSDTIESHKNDVRAAIYDATIALATDGGLTALTMSAVAERAGITRATLYKYFADVDAILGGWHERQVQRNLAELVAARDGAKSSRERLVVVLDTYARLVHEQHGAEYVALPNLGDASARGYRALADMLREIISADQKAGRLRKDVPPAELASFCVQALSGAHALPSMAAVRRLVSVTIAGLRRPRT